jgi:hypothetical protein
VEARRLGEFTMPPQQLSEIAVHATRDEVVFEFFHPDIDKSSIEVRDVGSGRLLGAFLGTYDYGDRLGETLILRGSKPGTLGQPVGSVLLWNPGSGAPMELEDSGTQISSSAEIGPNKRFAADRDSDGAVRVRDLHTGRTLAKVGPDSYSRVEFAADGVSYLAQLKATVVQIRNVCRSAELVTVPGLAPRRPASGEQWNAELGTHGHLLATAGEDDTVSIWDLNTGRRLRVLAGHSAPVRKLRFAADDGLLITTSDDSTVRVWDLRDLPAEYRSATIKSCR